MIADATVATVALCEDAHVDPRLFALLVLHFGSPENVLEHSDRLAEVPQISPGKAERIVAAGDTLDKVRVRLEALATRGVRIISIVDSEYPESLQRIAEPPSCLYLRGSLPAADSGVALLGAALATAEGIADAVAVGKELARLGAVLVSGLAGHVAGGAHLGCLTAGGKSYAVRGGGLDGSSTPEEEVLAGQIVAAGGVLSEYPPATRASGARTQAAARIIVGLSRALVVIEPESELAHMTAITEETLRDGKPVFVLSREQNDATAQLFGAGAYPLPAKDGLAAALKLV